MRDLLPDEVRLRRRLLGRIIGVYERFGFEQIETPALEEIDRLIGSEAGDNEKLIYKVLRRGLDEWPTDEAGAVDLGLRYDLTVPLARFYATHSGELLSPFKAIQTGPAWRAERPQKGRYRQLTQCDIDVLGDPTVDAEIELVVATAQALAACGVSDFAVRLNDRRVLQSLVSAAGFPEELTGPVLVALDKVDKMGVSGVHDELCRLVPDGDSPRALTDVIESLIASSESGETLSALPDAVADAVTDDLRSIVEGARELAPGLPIRIDATLVRGQGYYTGSIFEIEHAASAGSLAGGGRYDRMIGRLSGVETPAVGFSIGFERLVDLMTNADFVNEARRVVLLYANADGAAGRQFAQQTAERLRWSGHVVRVEDAAKNRKAQLSRFAAAGYTDWAEVSDDQQPIDGDFVLRALDSTTEGSR